MGPKKYGYLCTYINKISIAIVYLSENLFFFLFTPCTLFFNFIYFSNLCRLKMMKYDHFKNEYDTDQVQIKMEKPEPPKSLTFHQVEADGATNGIADPADESDLHTPE